MREDFENRNRKDIRVLLTREMDPYVERSLDASYTMHKIFDEKKSLDFLRDHGSAVRQGGHDAGIRPGLVAQAQTGKGQHVQGVAAVVTRLGKNGR